MDSYRILYRIRVEHDYFDGKPCTTFQCRLTPQGEALARWRGLLFRQTAPGEWAVLFNREPDTGLDTLMLALSIADASFPIYTAWDDFRPSANYELELPRKKETLEAANAGTPMQTVLHFHAPSVQWEYLFVPHSVSDLRADRIRAQGVPHGFKVAGSHAPSLRLQAARHDTGGRQAQARVAPTSAAARNGNLHGRAERHPRQVCYY